MVAKRRNWDQHLCHTFAELEVYWVPEFNPEPVLLDAILWKLEQAARSQPWKTARDVDDSGHSTAYARYCEDLQKSVDLEAAREGGPRVKMTPLQLHISFGVRPTEFYAFSRLVADIIDIFSQSLEQDSLCRNKVSTVVWYIKFHSPNKHKNIGEAH